MSVDEQTDFASQVADLNKYGQALNQCESVEEVVSLTLEAMSLLFETDDTTFVEVRNDDLRVVHSTNPDLSSGDPPGDVARTAFETSETVLRTGDSLGDASSEAAAALAVPAAIVEEVRAVLVMRSTTGDGFDDSEVRAVEILASHAATAISNIRSRERLERARQDLETKKEMVELYDRLLRHDLGNDLQVIAGFSEALVDMVEDEGSAHYAERIHEAAMSSSDLIQRVGTLVSTLEEEAKPEPRDLAPILDRIVREVETQYDDITVEFDATDFEYTVYAGELLGSVFTNILTNAVVHNDDPVTVWMGVEADVEEIVVSVADDGTGIDPAVRDDLFEMGEKGPDSGGSGFGLGFVRSLTESYGGDVTVSESQRGGAAFRVRLQRA